MSVAVFEPLRKSCRGAEFAPAGRALKVGVHLTYSPNLQDQDLFKAERLLYTLEVMVQCFLQNRYCRKGNGVALLINWHRRLRWEKGGLAIFLNYYSAPFSDIGKLPVSEDHTIRKDKLAICTLQHSPAKLDRCFRFLPGNVCWYAGICFEYPLTIPTADNE